MSSEFTRKNIDHYLYSIAKEYRKQNRSNPDCELILVGGSSIVLNYGFRDSTTDIDSIIRASSNMKDIVNKVGDENGLDAGWLNDDFKTTASYSQKLFERSRFYKRFYNCLNVRTVNDEYLVAMKLRSYREYKHDVSDIIGIIKENEERMSRLTYAKIEAAYKELYGDSAEISEKAKDKLFQILSSESLEDLYYSTVEEEYGNKSLLIEAEKQYKTALTQENATNFLRTLKDKPTPV